MDPRTGRQSVDSFDDSIPAIFRTAGERFWPL